MGLWGFRQRGPALCGTYAAVVKPYFVRTPATEVVFLGTIVVWAVIEVRQGLQRRREATTADRGTQYLLRICAIVASLVSAFAVSKVPGAAISFPEAVSVVALCIIWVGIGLRRWAFAALGRYFTFTVMTSADQPVISTGPYRFVRHPGYAGLELVFIGIGAAYGNWISLMAWTFIPLIGLLARIRVEESALSATVGDAYRRYASGRKRMIPFIW